MPQILEKYKGILRVHAGTASLENEKVDLAYSVNGSPVITFEDGTTIYWTWEELITEAVKLKESEINANKEIQQTGSN